MKITNVMCQLCRGAASRRWFSSVNAEKSTLSAELEVSPVLQQVLRSPTGDEVDQLVEFFRRTSSLLTITGAGVSTWSGIPDYRGPDGSYKRGHKPITHSEFLTSEYARKRYWARSMSGWSKFAQAKPNSAHYALRDLENDLGIVHHLVTQNVDRLHAKAGSKNLTDLHGRIDQVCCLQCGYFFARSIMQNWLLEMNPTLNKVIAKSLEANPSLMRADGDAEILDFDNLLKEHNMQIPSCPQCLDGTLKPDVILFGDNVPMDRVLPIFEDIDKKCDALLVVGTSLEVFSAYRFVRRAAIQRNLPIAIINYGTTRAERVNLPNIAFKSEAHCGQLLQAAVGKLREEIY